MTDIALFTHRTASVGEVERGGSASAGLAVDGSAGSTGAGGSTDGGSPGGSGAAVDGSDGGAGAGGSTDGSPGGSGAAVDGSDGGAGAAATLDRSDGGMGAGSGSVPEIAFVGPSDAMGRVVGLANALLAELAALSLGGAGRDVLRSLVAVLGRVRAGADAAEARTVTALEGLDDGGVDAVEVLRRNAGSSQREARRRRRRAEALAQMPNVAGALAAGDISPEHADALARAAAATSAEAVDSDRDLLAQVAGVPADRAGRHVQNWTQRHQDPADLHEQHLRQWRRRHLYFGDGDDGMLTAHAAFDRVLGAQFRSLINGIADRLWRVEGGRDNPNSRSAEQRRLDALAIAVGLQPAPPVPVPAPSAADAGTAPGRGGSTSSGTGAARDGGNGAAPAGGRSTSRNTEHAPGRNRPTTDGNGVGGPARDGGRSTSRNTEAARDGGAARTTHRPEHDSPSGTEPSSDSTEPSSDSTEPSSDSTGPSSDSTGPSSDSTGATTGGRAARPNGPDRRRTNKSQRRRTNGSNAGGNIDDGGGRAVSPRHQIVIVASADVVSGKDPQGRCEIPGIGPIPVSELERLACDAELFGVLFSGDGEPLWHGRGERTVTDAQRRALVARDGVCVLCANEPALCESHHIIPWAPPARGPTDIDNLALLCGTCHRRLHNHKRVLVRRPDGAWSTQPDPRHAHRANRARPDKTTGRDPPGQ